MAYTPPHIPSEGLGALERSLLGSIGHGIEDSQASPALLQALPSFLSLGLVTLMPPLYEQVSEDTFVCVMGPTLTLTDHAKSLMT